MEKRKLKQINLGYKYRLYPNKKQENLLLNNFFLSNQSYNILNNIWKLEQDKKRGKLTKKNDYDNLVKKNLVKRELSFKGRTALLQQTRINFFKSVERFFSAKNQQLRKEKIAKAKTKKQKQKAFDFGKPKFKDSRSPYQSYTWNNQGFQILEHSEKYKILKIHGEKFKVRFHRELPESYKIKVINISKSNSQYFVSFSIEYFQEINNIEHTKSTGIDINCENFAISGYEKLLDNGAKNRKQVKTNQKILRLQRKKSRMDKLFKKRKISKKNSSKIQEKINKIHLKLSNHKNNLYHKITSQLVQDFDICIIEDLKIKNMTKSAKGNIENPGKQVKQKSGLNRSFLESSPTQFVNLLEYKIKLNDKILIRIDPKYTSQTCNKCQYKDKANRKNQSKFKCLNCGYTINADINASKNILDKGLEKLKSLRLGISPQTINESLSNSSSIELVS